jgi:type I restriction enzyme S subunit
VNKIDELIQQLCPDGVPRELLGQICIIKTGQPVSKVIISKNPGEYPVINSGREPLGFIDIYNTEDDPIGITSRGAGVGSVTWCPGKYYRGNLNYSVTNKDTEVMNVRFLYYLLMQNQSGIQQLATYQGIPALNKSSLEKLRIPIPPLEVQREIVNILDKFTQLEAELSAELYARRKQYEHYRNGLLTYDDSDQEVEWATLGEVMKIVRGASPRPINNFFTSDHDGVNWIKIGDVKPGAKYITSTKQKITQAGASKSRFLKPGDFVLSNSMSFGRPYILNIEGCIHDGWISMSNYEDRLVADFLYHLLNSDYVQKIWRQKASNGTVQNLNADIVRATIIPIPPKKEQKRIADLLDKFDLLINDISDGLPAEINARRQQYEYYRAKLLAFQEITV